MKLTNLRIAGRYQRPNGTKVNVWVGQVVGKNYERLFYLCASKRVFIDDSDFYNHWKRIGDYKKMIDFIYV